MLMNVIFLIGGIGIGYLIRGEIERKKSKKAMNDIIDASLTFAKEMLNNLETNKEETENAESQNVWTVEPGNSNDETIQLDDFLRDIPIEDK